MCFFSGKQRYQERFLSVPFIFRLQDRISKRSLFNFLFKKQSKGSATCNSMIRKKSNKTNKTLLFRRVCSDREGNI